MQSIKVGQVWSTRVGATVTVVKDDGFGILWVRHESGFVYRVFHDGKYTSSAELSSLDLIELITDIPVSNTIEISVVLHTTNGDVVSTFQQSTMHLAKDLIASYLKFGKSFSVKQ